ncbi:MAG: aspartate carbamoyltransferase, partial [Desulfobacteraceae bacterium]|nr:aspartate carbamoyltransferase [Desulfobacteraceae bacterium]
MQFTKKDILDMESLSAEEISLILDNAESMKEISSRPIKKVPTLRGKTVALCFLAPDVSVRCSFDVAAQRLSADHTLVSQTDCSHLQYSAVSRLVAYLEHLRTDIIVIRHPHAGVPSALAQRLKTSVINAGDGNHAHPCRT